MGTVNFLEQLMEAAPETITHVVIGFDDRDWDSRFCDEEDHPVLTLDEAKEVLSYNYDNGYGGAGCHAVYAWTENFVIFVSEYDGATGFIAIPRNPVPCNPGFA